jgi:hypothetical protein
MTLEQYISNINKEYKRGISTEHTYRGDLKQLLESIVPDIAATNEPKRISCGAPDYVLIRKDIPFGFIEAMDIGDKDLSKTKKTGNKEQFDRYKNSLYNLIFTDYLDFHLYIDGVFNTKIAIAEIVFDKNGANSVMALPENFVYAQTIAYGMFFARLHDPTLPTFSRQEAAELIPKSNPFLRKLFGYIAGPDLDDRIKWVVDSLVDIFLACNVEQILKTYGKSTKMEDPIIHFYETFLSEYDPKLRKAKGVWYTPKPVVNFIVRAVDDILKKEFCLPQGLPDTSKTKIKVDLQGKKVEQEVPANQRKSGNRTKSIDLHNNGQTKNNRPIKTVFPFV